MTARLASTLLVVLSLLASAAPAAEGGKPNADKLAAEAAAAINAWKYERAQEAIEALAKAAPKDP
ncbi:MAG: hypothetical protein ACYTGB_14440, partial [Planctomycetota bacterium]